MSVMDGVGLQGWVEIEDDWKHIIVGNERLLKTHGGKLRPSKKMQIAIDEFYASHKQEVILYVVIEDEIKCLLSLSGQCFSFFHFCVIYPDEIRPDAEEMVRRMHQLKFDVVMLTGDHKEVAEEVGQSIDITKF
jgi:cation transport ATPase